MPSRSSDRSVEAVFAGRNALKVTWKGGATAGYNSEAALAGYSKRLGNADEKGLPLKPTGDVEAAFAKAAKVVSGEYLTDYVYHAQMEPMNITASVSAAGDAAEIWVGTQGPTVDRRRVASAVLKTDFGKIQVHQQFLGGGFGRRIYWDLVPYVLLTSKEMKRPVKMIWPREQDVQIRVAAADVGSLACRLALSDKGDVLGWKHRLVAEATLGYAQPDELVKTKGFDYLTLEGVEHKYAIDGKSAEWLREDRGTALAAWRAIGSGFNKFAIESFHRRHRARIENGSGRAAAQAAAETSARPESAADRRRHGRVGQAASQTAVRSASPMPTFGRRRPRASRRSRSIGPPVRFAFTTSGTQSIRASSSIRRSWNPKAKATSYTGSAKR